MRAHTFKTEIRPPQFRIRRTQLSFEPGIGTLFQTVEGWWTTRNPQPSDLEYQMMPESRFDGKGIIHVCPTQCRCVLHLI